MHKEKHIRQVLDQLAQARQEEEEKIPPHERQPKPHKFNEALDKAGIPLESHDYARPNCKHCFGRGYETVLVSTGPTQTIWDNSYTRVTRVCICVHRGYSRKRKAVEAAA